ncbi:Zinc finger, GRF-type [Sesbania bispinosa]|nr:Zinc finger, GRF-type [Sesbania bispinosa]
MGSRQKSYSSYSVSGRRLCGCGDEIVTLTYGSAKNPGRKFFRCPNWKNPSSCNFFQWIDEEFSGGEGECRGGGKCNFSDILIERLIDNKNWQNEEKYGGREKKVKILKSIVVVVLGYFN